MMRKQIIHSSLFPFPFHRDCGIDLVHLLIRQFVLADDEDGDDEEGGGNQRDEPENALLSQWGLF